MFKMYANADVVIDKQNRVFICPVWVDRDIKCDKDIVLPENIFMVSRDIYNAVCSQTNNFDIDSITYFGDSNTFDRIVAAICFLNKEFDIPAVEKALRMKIALVQKDTPKKIKPKRKK